MVRAAERKAGDTGSHISQAILGDRSHSQMVNQYFDISLFTAQQRELHGARPRFGQSQPVRRRPAHSSIVGRERLSGSDHASSFRNGIELGCRVCARHGAGISQAQMTTRDSTCHCLRKLLRARQLHLVESSRRCRPCCQSVRHPQFRLGQFHRGPTQRLPPFRHLGSPQCSNQRMGLQDHQRVGRSGRPRRRLWQEGQVGN